MKNTQDEMEGFKSANHNLDDMLLSKRTSIITEEESGKGLTSLHNQFNTI